MIGVAAIRMLDVLRQYKKFIGAYFIALFTDLEPALSVHTVKQKIFRQSFFPVGKMILGLGIITDGADMQVPEHGIAIDPRLEDGPGNFNPLPAGPVPDILM